MKNSRIAFFEGGALAEPQVRTLPEQFLLLRFGRNVYSKNGETGEFEFTEADADAVLQDFAARSRDLVIDFEHQSLHGGKAPAAGWIGSLEKTSEGILAKIRYWTREAQEFLLQGQYRYFSPTLCFSRSGKRVTAIHSTALTNHPAMHGIPALVADDLPGSASDEASEAAVPGIINETSSKLKGKNMNQFLTRLGLEAFCDADEEERCKAIEQRLCALTDMEKSLQDFLKINGLTDLANASEKLRTLHSMNAEKAVCQAFADGKLSENMRPWALRFAENEPAAFADWCNAAPRIIPANTGIPQTDAAPYNQTAVPGSEEARILRLLGLSEQNHNKNMKGIC